MTTTTQTQTIREEFLNKALDAANRVHTLTETMLESDAESEGVRNEVAMRTAEIAQAVATEINGAGKPTFSNEQARNAEIAVRKSNDEQLQRASEALQNHGLVKAKTQAAIGLARDHISIYKAFLHGGD